MENENNLPLYRIVKEVVQEMGTRYVILGKDDKAQLDQITQTYHQNNSKTVILSLKKAKDTKITSNIVVEVFKNCEKSQDYLGCITDFLSSAYKFDRKSQISQKIIVSILDSTPQVHEIVAMVQALNQAREWGNGRGDIEGTPAFFQFFSQKFAEKNKQCCLSLTVIKGEDLIKNGFCLLHAVGRGSKNEPTFVNLSFKGNPDSNEWIAFVGKGVCFDTGGYNIKNTSQILEMFLDKCGATTVLSVFKTVVQQRLPINLTCSIGLVQNFVGSNAYRPSDIIKSRKGLTVEIGNTDSEGRLILADCMHWTQQKYKTTILIELSTLTGAVQTAIGSNLGGLFTNNQKLGKILIKIGEIVHEESWYLPCTDYHKQLITPLHCDLTNNSGKNQARASQAAAFLKSFVQVGTNWVHFDIGGVGMSKMQATGWGSRLLLQFCSLYSKQKLTYQPMQKALDSFGKA